MLLSHQIVGDIVKAKSIEYAALRNFITVVLKRLVREVGLDFAAKIRFTPLYLFYDLLSSYRSLVGYLDPINICSLTNIERIRNIFLTKLLNYLHYLEKQEVLCSTSVPGFFKICEGFLRKMRIAPLLIAERLVQEVLIPYMEYSLKIRNIIPLAILIPEARKLLSRIAAPSPYSELYISVNNEILPFHRGFEKISYIRSLGSTINYTFLGEMTVRGRKVPVVVKKYRDWKSLKWLPIGLWTTGTVDFTLSAGERLLREVNAIMLLRKSGFRVPMIYGINWHEKYIIREYVEGDDLVKKLHSKDLEKTCFLMGCFLAKVHRLGLSLGDTRPSNFVFDKYRTIVPIDLEQASSKIPPSWDLAEYLAFTIVHLKFKFDESFASSLSLAKGYLENGGSLSNICDITRRSYIRVLSPISPIYSFIAKKLYRELGCSQ